VPTIRERAKKNGTRVFHVQVRMAGYPLTHRELPDCAAGR
jgi:hypothetical protein